MPTITIRNVPTATRDELAARAVLAGRSLGEYLRVALIELAERPDPAVWASRVRERKKRTGSSLSGESILGHDDADRP